MEDGVIETSDAGFSHLGKMNRLGMFIDGSHAGLKTSMDALNITTQPFVFSHSNAYTIAHHVRNVRDEQIKAVAKSAGVVGINGLGLLSIELRRAKRLQY